MTTSSTEFPYINCRVMKSYPAQRINYLNASVAQLDGWPMLKLNEVDPQEHRQH